MGSFFSLFNCDSSASNRGYEERFKWFFVAKDEKNRLRRIQQSAVARLVGQALDQPSDHSAAMSLSRLLGVTLEREAYEAFLDEIGLAITIAIFYDDGVENADGFTDFGKTKDAHFRKYCLFKFASFLDLLCPGVVRWRGEAELGSVSLVGMGLDRFQGADLQGRTSMLSRWIRNPGPAAFSETKAKQSEGRLKRRAFLLTLDGLTAAKVAQRLDDAGFKPRKYSSYIVRFLANPKSFESWLSRERAESRKVWRKQPRMSAPKSKLS